MIKPVVSIHKYWVPLLALIVIAIHFTLVRTSQLNKWKGGGFGMYSEVHPYYLDVVILNLNRPLDSLLLEDREMANFVKIVKRFPNADNLQNMAILTSKYVDNDTIVVQVWKPLINARNSSYSRELVNQYQFVKL